MFQWLKSLWTALDYVPNCPACGGSGEVNPKWATFAETVYWKGDLVVVCHNCRGAGKV